MTAEQLLIKIKDITSEDTNDLQHNLNVIRELIDRHQLNSKNNGLAVVTLEEEARRSMHDPSQYIPGNPGGEGVKIDQEVCREIACEKCGNPSTRYRGFIHKDPTVQSYYAFAVCPKCGHAVYF